MRGDSPGFMSALRGPILMIAIGVLFLLDKLTPMRFSQTWPVLLIVVGALALAGGGRRLRSPQTGEFPTRTPDAPPYVPPYVPPGAPPPNMPPPGGRR